MVLLLNLWWCSLKNGKTHSPLRWESTEYVWKKKRKVNGILLIFISWGLIYKFILIAHFSAVTSSVEAKTSNSCAQLVNLPSASGLL